MRYSVTYGFVFILSLLVHFSAVAQQQDTSRLTAEYNNKKARQFLDDLHKQTGFYSYYDSKELDSVLVTVAVKNGSLTKILAEAFNNTGVYFSIDNNQHIFLSKKAMVRTSLPVVSDKSDTAENKDARDLANTKGEKEN